MCMYVYMDQIRHLPDVATSTAVEADSVTGSANLHMAD